MTAGLGGRLSEDQLLRAHWLMAYDYDPKKWQNSRSIKNRFSLRAYRGRHATLLQDLSDYLDSLKNTSTAYCDIYAPTREGAFNDIPDPTLHREVVLWSKKLSRLGPHAAFLPLLMAVRIKARDSGQAYLEAVQLCERYDFRVFQWLRYRANAGETLLFRLGYQFYRDPQIGRLKDDLARAILYYCADERFQERFDDEKENWYHWGGITYLLYEYEHHLAGGRPVQMSWESVSARLKADSIEHVLPQTPEDTYWLARFTPEQRQRWTHDLGNLTLTYDNSSLGNRNFIEKKGQPGQVGRFAGSPLFTERQLAGYTDWTEAQIVERRETIRKWAMDRWRIEAPAASNEDGLPPEFTAERIQVLAEQHGVGEPYLRILDSIQPFSLYPSPKKWCVVIAPPRNRNLALGAIWPEPGRLKVGIWHNQWPLHMNIPLEEVRERLGAERYQYVDASNVAEFVQNLEMLLKFI